LRSALLKLVLTRVLGGLISAAPLRLECPGGMLFEIVERMGRDARTAARVALRSCIDANVWRPLYRPVRRDGSGMNLRV
jgi:hypothetical protein